MDDLDVYTRLGGMVWRADSTATINATSAGTQKRFSENDTGVSPVFALGTEYAITLTLLLVLSISGSTTSVIKVL